LKDKIKNVFKNLTKDLKNKNKNRIALTMSIAAFIIAFSIVLQMKTVKEYKKANVEDLREDEIKTQISTYQSKYEEAKAQLEENQNKIEEYKTTTDEKEKASSLLDNELNESKTLLGLTDVKGEGVIITLKDTDDNKFTSENLRYLVNELKYAGAEAISINGNRIVNLTDIATINDNFIIMNNGEVRLNSPYEIKAIGDRKYLTSTLNMKNSGFVDLMKSNNLNVEVKESDNITIGKYIGNIKSNYIKEEN